MDRRALLALVVGLEACRTCDRGPAARVAVEEICLQGNPQVDPATGRLLPQQLVPDASLRVEVRGQARTLDVVIEAQSCTVTRDGNSFTLVENLVASDATCDPAPPPGLIFPQATCDLGRLAAGDYLVVQGSRRLSFTIPGTIPPPGLCAR